VLKLPLDICSDYLVME